MVALLPLPDDARFEPVEEVAFVCRQLRDGSDDLMQSADVTEQGGNGNQRSAEHQAGLNHVRPDDGLDAAERRIEEGHDGESDDRDEVGTDRSDCLLAELNLPASDEHAVRQHHHERRDEEPRSRRQCSHEQEESRDVALGPLTEANAEVIVDRIDLVGEVGLEEDVTDDEAPDNEAQDELHVGEAFVGVPLAGRSEEGGCTGFRSDDGGHHGPPRDASPSERKVVQALFASPHVQPNGRNGHEIKEDDDSVDQKLPLCSYIDLLSVQAEFGLGAATVRHPIVPIASSLPRAALIIGRLPQALSLEIELSESLSGGWFGRGGPGGGA